MLHVLAKGKGTLQKIPLVVMQIVYNFEHNGRDVLSRLFAEDQRSKGRFPSRLRVFHFLEVSFQQSFEDCSITEKY